jgi:hypothetical protein
MPFTTSDETNLAKLVYQNVAWAGLGDTNGPQPSATAGSLYIALFTADPTTAGVFTNETAYTGYARVAIARSSSGFTVAGGAPASVTNTAITTFGNCTAAPGSPVTYVGYCTAITGGRIVSTGTLTASYQPAVGNAPQFAAGALTATIL